MNKWLIGCGAVLLIGIIVLVCVVGYYISVSRQGIALKNQYEALEKDVTGEYDTCWKIIQEQAHIADTYKDGFIAVMKEVSAGRAGGAMFKSTVESNMPGLPPEMYRIVMASIEGRRDKFMAKVRMRNDVAMHYNNLVDDPIKGFIVHGPKLTYQTITSTRTENAWQTGKDDQVLGSPKK